MRNVKTTSNLSLRKKQRMLKLEANVNGQLVKKSTKFFLNLEKNDPLKRFVRKLEVNWKEMCDQTILNYETRIFSKKPLF